MIVDAHQHFWRRARGDYGWLTPDLEILYRDYEPTDLAPLVADAEVDATIIVQAAPTEAETRHCLALAREWPVARGVVGWVDFDDPHMPSALSRLVAEGEGLLKGVRPMIQDIPDTGWIARPALDAAFDAVIEHDLVFDALVKPQHLPGLCDRLERHPALRCVIDHGAKPSIAARTYSGWAAAMQVMATHDAVAGVKLSGLLTEAAAGDGIEEVRPYVDHLVACFGPERLIWGSDWPVLNLAGDYRGWFDMARALTEPLGAAAQRAIFGGNAARIYRMEGAAA
jgi:L-fuconolactonase